MPIQFGTDGWRGVIAEDFTFHNVRLCAQGTAALFRRKSLDRRGLIIGYDTRFASEDFAAAVAEVTAANGLSTVLCDKACPTPVTAYNLVRRKLGGGVIITASHNPARWNGYKFRPDYGGSAPPETIQELEALIAQAEREGHVPRMDLKRARREGLVDLLDPVPAYLEHLGRLVDLGAARGAGLKVVVDSMHGAGAGYLARLLEGGATTVEEIRRERNPVFPGMAQPEPIAHNLAPLMELVSSTGADVGLATDGDADRLGVVDERGRFVTTLQTFALLCWHQLEVLGRRGPIVRSITTTAMVDRLGQIYGVPVFDTPVGFKHLGPTMQREDALIAGEESGGYAYRDSIPERDGILSALMVLDLMVRTGKKLTELLEELTDLVGPHFFERWDLAFDPDRRGAIQRKVDGARPDALAGMRVTRRDTRDGVRFLLEGGYWAMVRFSGTEPLLRLYAEAPTPEKARELLATLRDMAGL